MQLMVESVPSVEIGTAAAVLVVTWSHEWRMRLVVVVVVVVVRVAPPLDCERRRKSVRLSTLVWTDGSDSQYRHYSYASYCYSIICMM